jgi:cytochrome c nitrite reductase small subunit
MEAIHRIARFFLPPPDWRMPVILLLGAFGGIGAYAMVVSNAVSYLSDSPATCVNCHIMAPQYATWFHSAHREHATCNDCHVPQDNFFKQYYFKASDGLRHATIFTLRNEPNVIVMHAPGRAVVQENCKRCHEYTNERVSASRVTFLSASHGEGRLCWDCHRDVPHGTVRSLAAVPDARVPVPASPVPEWLNELLEP